MTKGLEFHTHSGDRRHERQPEQRDEKQGQDCHKTPSMFTYDIEHEFFVYRMSLISLECLHIRNREVPRGLFQRCLREQGTTGQALIGFFQRSHV